MHPKCVCGRSSAPNPAGELTALPQSPSCVWGGRFAAGKGRGGEEKGGKETGGKGNGPSQLWEQIDAHDYRENYRRVHWDRQQNSDSVVYTKCTRRMYSPECSNSAFHPSGVDKSSTSLRWLGLRRDVLAYVGLQIKLCDTILQWQWHPVVLLRWLAHEELIRI